MGDYFPAFINIGGTIDKRGARALLKACENSETWPNYEGQKPDLTGTPIEQIAQLYAISIEDREPQKHLTLCSSQARGGEFEEVETVCRNIGLSYDRHNDACYETNAGWECWRPGMRYGMCVASDQDANRLIEADIVIRAYKALMAGSFHECLHFLHPIVSPLIELGEVPPFVIIK